MTYKESLPDPVLSPASTNPLSHVHDASIKQPQCPPECLPSPPATSPIRGKQHNWIDIHLASDKPLASSLYRSPDSITAVTGAGSETPRRIVDFLPQPILVDLADPRSSIQLSRLSRECQSPKSILKPTGAPLSVQEVLTDQIENLPTVLDSVFQQLAGEDRIARLNAFITLHSIFQARSELSAVHITKQKARIILNHIRTELTRKLKHDTRPTETSSILQAQKVLMRILVHQKLSANLTDSFRSFLLDQSASVLESCDMPKSILLHYLHLLAAQDFSSSIMTPSRAGRLLEALKDLLTKVPGRAVVTELLLVYARMLGQVRAVFISKASCWLAQLLKAMTHPFTDIRTKAIAFGGKAALHLGSSPTVATSLSNMLDSHRKPNQPPASTTLKQLINMTKQPRNARQVPRSGL